MTNGISDGMRFYFFDSLWDTLWYNSVKHYKFNLQMIYKKRGTDVPFYSEQLDDHTLRVEHSATNEMLYPPSRSYPENCWITVLATCHINTKSTRELKKFRKHYKFKKLHSTILVQYKG